MIGIVRNKRTGLPVLASDAYGNKGDQHECLGCGVDLCLVQSPGGIPYARRYPGRYHAAGCPCNTMETTGYTYNLEEIDLDELHNAIMTPPSDGKGGGKGPGHPGGPRTDDGKHKKVSGLKHIYQLGLCNARDFEISNRYRLRDLILNRYTLPATMGSNDDIGRKLVVVKPDRFDRASMAIRFVAFSVYGRAKENVMKVFDLRFRDQVAFDRLRAKLFAWGQTDDKMGPKWLPRYDYVIVYGDWIGLPADDCSRYCRRSNCNGKWRCTGYQYADCTVPTHQIYCPPDHKRR